MIPKIIHYCWVGDAELDAVGRKCLESWKRFCPDWTIVEWNDRCLPLDVAYVAVARANRMYSNVSNFVRLHAVYHQGGIYLDADAELIRDPRTLLDERCFFGFQSSNIDAECVNSAIFGAVPHHPFVKQMLDRLQTEFSGLEESNLSGPGLATAMIRQHRQLRLGTDTDGSKVDLGDVAIFPKRAFSPFEWHERFHPDLVKPDTLVIHWWTVSWKQQPSPARGIASRIWSRLRRLEGQAVRRLGTRRSRRAISRLLREQVKPADRAPGRREEGVTLVCLVKDGELSIADFIEHHLQLGVRRIVLLDNQSTDRTASIARKYDRVEVHALNYRLSGHESQLAARRYLITELCRSRWCLWVDADELFDYPFSDRIGLDDLTAYLESHGYTVVVAQMLDMFSDRPLNEPPDVAASRPLREQYPFYDISNVDQQEYCSVKGFEHHQNRISNPQIKFHSGGVRRSVFGTNQWLTKHPLICLDGRLRPAAQQHWVTHASCADFSSVLLHFKFLPDFYRRNLENYENRFGSSDDYGQLVAEFRKDPGVMLKTHTAQRLGAIADLVDQGLLVVSREYRAWVARHAAS